MQLISSHQRQPSFQRRQWEQTYNEDDRDDDYDVNDNDNGNDNDTDDHDGDDNDDDEDDNEDDNDVDCYDDDSLFLDNPWKWNPCSFA